MKYYKVVELGENRKLLKKVETFLFKMIEKEYGYGYNPEYHHDIKNLKEVYLSNERNNFFIAIDRDENILGTIAIREYDKNFKELRNLYSKESTASVWRLFVNENFRRQGIASELVRKMEEFSRKKQYEKLYLHTHKNINGALDFWLSLNYNIIWDTQNDLKTVHMNKNIINNLYENKILIKDNLIKENNFKENNLINDNIIIFHFNEATQDSEFI